MPRNPSPHPSAWRRCRLALRLLRIATLSAILLLLTTLTWLRLFGLPGFLRVPIIDELARRGVVASFRSLHFHWFRGLVAEDLHVAWGTTNLPGLEFQIAEADLDIAPPSAWLNRRSLLRGISVRSGSFTLPLPVTNEPPEHLHLEDIAAQIRFQPGDHWEIPRLAARFEELQLELSASITNTAALRRPKTKPKPADPAARERTFRTLRTVVRELRSWTDASSARITLHLKADGERLQETHGDFLLDVPSAHTPRGNVLGLRLSSRFLPQAAPNAPSLNAVVLELAELQTPQGGLNALLLRAQLSAPANSLGFTNAQWDSHVDHLFLRGFRARNANLSGTSRIASTTNASSLSLDANLQGHAGRLEIGRGTSAPLAVLHSSFSLHAEASPTNPLPDRLNGTVSVESLQDSLGTSGPVRLNLNLARRTPSLPTPPDLGPWKHPWPYAGTIDLELAALQSPRLTLERLQTTLDWDAPHLTLSNLNASLYQGTLHAQGGLDILSRVASLSAEADFDLHGIDPLLGPKSRENFTRYQWQSPPTVQGRASVTLPPWNAPQVDWDATVKPTVKVDGHLQVGAGSFKGIPFDEAVSSISFDGATWRLPNLRTARPEGRQEIAVEYNEDTREYRIDARGRVLPPVLKPVLGDQSAEIVDLFEFRNGVDADVVVWGPWTEGTRQAIHGRIVATNFAFRAQHFDRLEATVGYTNRFLTAAPMRLTRDSGEATAEGVGYDFAEDRLWLTNALNTIDPYVAAAAISPSFPEKLVHYRFASPPRIRANGTLRPKHTETADLTFQIQGGPFEFWRLRAETLESDLIWKGDTLTLTNIAARFFDGTLAGHAFFDLQNPDDGPYRFEAQVRQANLGDLLRYASEGRTNVASGNIDLDLTVTSARTADIYSWNGFGRAELRDGLLWDTPIFGFASPILNAVVPGIGNSRARAAEATFTLTNSVIHTRDLTIDCPPAKLFYRGTLDFDQNVNAKVEAQVLGNFTPMGPLFGLILRPLTKLFEFRTTGTLTDVKVEPLYIPKFLLLPLQPLKLLRGLFGSGEGSPRHPVVNSQPEIPVPDPVTPTNAPLPSPRN